MARELKTDIEIDAPAETVWEVLTDFSHYSQWNPFIRSISGNGMTFRPIILALQPGRELRWLGRLLLPGIFDGEHQFQIESLGENRTRLIQREAFSGLLVPFLWSSLDKQTRQGFEEMNRALKIQAENSYGLA
jgi:hypothetical protein